MRATVLEAVKGRALCARRARFHPLTAPVRPGGWSLSGRKAPRVSTASGGSNKRRFRKRGWFSVAVRVGVAR
jgi:hypothetical protein